MVYRVVDLLGVTVPKILKLLVEIGVLPLAGCFQAIVGSGDEPGLLFLKLLSMSFLDLNEVPGMTCPGHWQTQNPSPSDFNARSADALRLDSCSLGS